MIREMIQPRLTSIREIKSPYNDVCNIQNWIYFWIMQFLILEQARNLAEGGETRERRWEAEREAVELRRAFKSATGDYRRKRRDNGVPEAGQRRHSTTADDSTENISYITRRRRCMRLLMNWTKSALCSHCENAFGERRRGTDRQEAAFDIFLSEGAKEKSFSSANYCAIKL